MATANKLGRQQKGLLGALDAPHGARQRGVWHPGSGWHYGGLGATIRICKTLEARGILEHDIQLARTSGYPLSTCFRLTPAGEDLIKTLKAVGDL